MSALTILCHRAYLHERIFAQMSLYTVIAHLVFHPFQTHTQHADQCGAKIRLVHHDRAKQHNGAQNRANNVSDGNRVCCESA